MDNRCIPGNWFIAVAYYKAEGKQKLLFCFEECGCIGTAKGPRHELINSITFDINYYFVEVKSCNPSSCV